MFTSTSSSQNTIDKAKKIGCVIKSKAKNPNTGIINTSKKLHKTMILPIIWDFESLHFPPIATRAKMIATIRNGKYTNVVFI